MTCAHPDPALHYKIALTVYGEELPYGWVKVKKARSGWWHKQRQLVYDYIKVHAVQALSLEDLLIPYSVHLTFLVYFKPSTFQDICQGFYTLRKYYPTLI